jgi:hypothetical protein
MLRPFDKRPSRTEPEAPSQYIACLVQFATNTADSPLACRSCPAVRLVLSVSANRSIRACMSAVGVESVCNYATPYGYVITSYHPNV